MVAAADAGHYMAEYDHGRLLHKRGETEEAEQWLRRAADAGYRVAEFRLGVLLKQAGKTREAEEISSNPVDQGRHDHAAT